MYTQFNEMDSSQSPLDKFGSQYDSEDEDTYTFADVGYDTEELMECDTKEKWDQVGKSSVPGAEFSKSRAQSF